ncbi:STAS domain-containing protein [Streptomyces sp. NPDC008079]|uniref:STAS domain-containing protein n=1 Tax=Streptomyces sp. NPDC008079 TaxID=3364806 RepID=UPI0036E37357
MSELDRGLSAHDDDAGAVVHTSRMITHPTDALAVRVSQRAGHTVVTVSGEIDFTGADTFARVLIDHLLCESDSLSLELSGVAFFDCGGLNALLRARRVAECTGAVLRLTAVSPAVQRVLGLTGAAGLFDYAEGDGPPPPDPGRPPEAIRSARERPLRMTRAETSLPGWQAPTHEDGGHAPTPARVVHHRVDDVGDHVGADPGIRVVRGGPGGRAQVHGRTTAR